MIITDLNLDVAAALLIGLTIGWIIGRARRR